MKVPARRASHHLGRPRVRRTGEGDDGADAKRRRKKVPLMVANLAQEAIGADDNQITLLDDSGTHKLARAPKEAVAKNIVARIAALYKNEKKHR